MRCGFLIEFNLFVTRIRNVWHFESRKTTFGPRGPLKLYRGWNVLWRWLKAIFRSSAVSIHAGFQSIITVTKYPKTHGSNFRRKTDLAPEMVFTSTDILHSYCERQSKEKFVRVRRRLFSTRVQFHNQLSRINCTTKNKYF